MRRLVLAAALAAMLPARPARAQQGSSWVIMLGTDTIAVERATPTPTGLNVEQALRTPSASLRHWHLTMTPAGRATELDYMIHAIGNAAAPLLGRLTMAMHGDSATVTQVRGDSSTARTVPVPPDPVMAPPLAFAPYELAARRALAAHRDTVQLTFGQLGGGSYPVTAIRTAPDSLLFRTPDGPWRAHVDAGGRLLGLSGHGSTFQVDVTRVPDVDPTARAAAWKAAEPGAGTMGALSPADSVRATLGAATVAIRYSRPAVRGRRIFPDVVPYGQVWRTGANEATTLTVSARVKIGTLDLAPGTYTLWTVPTENGTTLIVNRLTTAPNGRPLWGTGYDAAKDIGRTAMRTTTLAQPVERFTIALEPSGARSVSLVMRWADREMRVPVSAR